MSQEMKQVFRNWETLFNNKAADPDARRNALKSLQRYVVDNPWDEDAGQLFQRAISATVDLGFEF